MDWQLRVGWPRISAVSSFCWFVFGVNSSPFLLNATLRHHIRQYSLNPEFVENLLNSFFVDDLVSGERNLERCLLEGEAQGQAQGQAPWINSRRKNQNQGELPWITASSRRHWDRARITMGHLEELDLRNEHKVLGLNWNCVFDEFISNL